jgi:hypothetical protein
MKRGVWHLKRWHGPYGNHDVLVDIGRGEVGVTPKDKACRFFYVGISERIRSLVSVIHVSEPRGDVIVSASDNELTYSRHIIAI